MNKSITPLGHAIRAITMEHARSTAKRAWRHVLGCAALAAAVLSQPSSSSAATETVDGLEWTYAVSRGKAIIGNNEYSFLPDSAISTSTKGIITIPSTLGGYPVTRIGKSALGECYSLELETIPNLVTSIGEEVFKGFPELKTVFLQEGYSGNTNVFPGGAKIVRQ